MLASFVVIILGSGLFVNSVEWFGKHLNLGQGMVGSVLAAIGTALPETLIPVVAILYVGGESAHAIGVGAILGAPFLLGTIAIGQLGFSIWYFSRKNGRSPVLHINEYFVRRDLSFFLVFYTAAVACAFVPSKSVRIGVAIALLLGYAYFVYLNLTKGGDEAEHEDLEPLHFAPKLDTPHLSLVVLQLIAALGLLILGAHLFVGQAESLAHFLGASPLLLALIIAPLATELPETLNSVLWVRQKKDLLAVGNITGAMVFQSTIPVALGVSMTSWTLGPEGLISAGLAVTAALIYYLSVRFKKALPTKVLLIGAVFYIGYVVYILAGSPFTG